MNLCVAMSDVALAVAQDLEPLVAAVTYKRYRAERPFAEATVFMDTPFSIVDPDVLDGLERLGLWKLMRARTVVSLAFDLGPAALKVDEVPAASGYLRARLRSRRLTRDEYIEQARKNLLRLRERFPGTIRLENINYFPTPDDAYADVCEPEFITHVLEALDGELLLDVAHASITAANFGIPVIEYLAALPLQKVTEVHLSACNVIEGSWEDTHEPPGPLDWELFSWLRQRAPIHYVTIEYYKRSDLLVEAYRELAARARPAADRRMYLDAERPS